MGICSKGLEFNNLTGNKNNVKQGEEMKWKPIQKNELAHL